MRIRFLVWRKAGSVFGPHARPLSHRERGGPNPIAVTGSPFPRREGGWGVRPVACALFLALVGTLSCVSQAQAAPQQILVEVVKSPVLVYDSPDQKKGAPLRPGKQTVAAGRWLKAGKTGKTFGVVRAYTLRGVKESKADGWLALTPLAASEATPYAAMLAEIMRPAGRLKGTPPPMTPPTLALWYPAPFGKTWLDGFQLRWTSLTAKTLRFKLTSGDGNAPLWESGEIDPTLSRVEDPALTVALKAGLAKGQSLTLTAQSEGDSTERMLQLGNAATQPELTADLAWWTANAKGVAMHLGRAGAYQKRGFLADAALAYLEAWEAAPNSSVAREGFEGTLERLGLEGIQIAAVMKQVGLSPKR